MIKFVDMFSGIGGFREGLTRAGGFECVGHCEIDKYANRSYNALFDTKGEWFIEDARKADPSTIPNRSKLYAGYSMPTPQGKHFNRLPMRCLPKVSPTVRMHLAGTLRTASEHFTARSIVDFSHPHDHITIIGIIKRNVKVVIV